MTEEATTKTDGAGTDEGTTQAKTTDEAAKTYTQADVDNIAAKQEATRVRLEGQVATLKKKADDAKTAAMSTQEKAIQEAKTAGATEAETVLKAAHADEIRTLSLKAALAKHTPDDVTEIAMNVLVAAAKATGAEKPADAVAALQAAGLLGSNGKHFGPEHGGSGKPADAQDFSAEGVQKTLEAMDRQEDRIAYLTKHKAEIEVEQQRSMGVRTIAPGSTLVFTGGELNRK